MKNICDTIHLKNLLDEDFSNYKKASLFLGFSKCSFKCDKEFNATVCQNASLSRSPSIAVSIPSIYERFVHNSMTQAIVCGGLEPFDTFEELYGLIKYFRDKGDKSEFVIYTGYYPDEIMDKLGKVVSLGNIIVKYGRFRPNEEGHVDKVLGVKLASSNQFAVEYR